MSEIKYIEGNWDTATITISRAVGAYAITLTGGDESVPAKPGSLTDKDLRQHLGNIIAKNIRVIDNTNQIGAIVADPLITEESYEDR